MVNQNIDESNGYIQAGAEISPQGQEGGFDQSWYPLALAQDIKPGEVKGINFLDGRVILYRGESGKPYVSSAFCRHVGADLSVGKVIGENIRCAFHHWSYDKTGKCAHIPAGDDIPENARLFVFPTVEKLGLIWAFNGEKALFDPPYFDGFDDEELAFKSSSLIELPQDPWVLLSNSHDFQHLEALHELTIHSEPDDIRQPDPYHMEASIIFEDKKFGRMEQFQRIFGTNILTLTGTMQGQTMCTLFGGKPEPGNQTQGFMCTATRKSDGTPEDEGRVQMVLEQGEAFFRSLSEDDDPIVRVARFRNDNLSSSDWALAKFFEYVRTFPRAHPSKNFIS